MAHILIVEDDPLLGESLRLNLELENNTVTWAKDLRSARVAFDPASLGLVILDLGLPDGSGFDFCRELRQSGQKVHVIMLTAQADEDSVVQGFAAGANDYVKKPFSTKELLARVGAALRPPTVAHDDEVRFGSLTMQLKRRRLMVGATEIPLNRREFDLLNILVERPDIVVTREEIIQKLSMAEDIFDRTIDSHVSRLRSKLKTAKVKDVRIKSEYGLGYRLQLHV